jgi:transcription-repair coupling factor (superfamily II helicase)
MAAGKPKGNPAPEAGGLAELLDAAAARAAARLPLRIGGVRGGAKGWLLGSLAGRLAPGGNGAAPPLAVVCATLQRAEDLLEDLRCFGETGAWLFPPWDTVPFDGFSPSAEAMGRRFEALAALREGHCRLLITSPQSWMQGMLSLEEWQARAFTVTAGERYPRQSLVQRLLHAGYARVDLVEAPGEFSARGEIVDIFPVHTEHPVRLDFFDNDLESLRWFEVDSQKSLEIGDPVRSVTIHPASEAVVTPETAAQALARLPDFKTQVQPETYRQIRQYLEQAQPYPGREQHLALFHGRVGWLHEALPCGTVVVLDQPAQVAATAGAFFEEVLGEFELSLRQGNLALAPEALYLSAQAFQSRIAGYYCVELDDLRLEEGAGTLLAPFADNEWLRAHAVEQGGGAHATLTAILAQLRAWRDAGAPVYLGTRSQTGAERLKQVLAEFDLAAAVAPPGVNLRQLLEAGLDQVRRREVADLRVLTHSPHHGFRLVDEQGETRLALVTEEELLGEKTRQRRLKKSKLQHFIASLGELKEGDLVVHVEYGIGRYEGLRRMTAGQEEGDFLVLAYAGGDKVYVPVHKFHQVQKYTGLDGGGAPLNRLGDGAWAKSKARASRAVRDMAEELVKLYAARKARAGHAFEAPAGLLAEFEEAFPFQETEDQQRAIEEVLGDMVQGRPMDRLVCGDVGFGKTEVAMRAAYLCVLGGKQAMILVPTTILAQQHYETFLKRFDGFPVTIDVISRFRAPQEQKLLLKRFSEGTLDILIGTHRLLSSDVAPKDLGLLVIDEEHRFGVAHKEKIKQLKTQVDVVTLSATPIPRTLHMSLMGVRDLSIINTPPMDRMAIRTRLVKAGDYIIREAVEREVRRGGQVFFVHNRVENIHEYGNYLRSLLPRVRLGIAHGQMPEKQLEEVMLEFYHGNLDVLLTTTIIESGLDIPRANTIIVNNADFFGLAQLYQLRGRVGRSNVQAYAYLMVSGDKALTDTAQKRLTLLQELNDLGSGFKIASHDLEIRGAGNLLGAEQSGHINAVGLELFTQMVEEAVAQLKGEEAVRPAGGEVKLELGFSYLLPERYIPSTKQRLDVYKRLAEVKSVEEAWELRQTIEDRFGKLPPEMGTLFTLLHIRLLAVHYGLAGLERASGQLHARFGRPDQVDVERLLKLVSDPASGVRLLPENKLGLGPMPPTPEGVLERLRLLDRIVNPKAA